jgi:hypothetical protein
VAAGIAKRRVTIDPRQMAIDFDAAVISPEPAVAPIPAQPPTTSEERIALRLRPLVGACEVVWTENRRTVLSSLRRRDHTVVRMHRIFAGASDDLLDAIGRYLHTGDRRASSAISRFVDANRASISASRPPRTLEALGAAHDLAAIFAEVEREHFAGQCAGVGITWGRRGHSPRSRRRSIRLGTYSHDDRVIRVHPTLDQAWVPRFFVRFIVFHEMLHHVEPARVTAARTEFHTHAFRTRERAYPDYERAIAWERTNLGRLLRT